MCFESIEVIYGGEIGYPGALYTHSSTMFVNSVNQPPFLILRQNEMGGMEMKFKALKYFLIMMGCVCY